MFMQVIHEVNTISALVKSIPELSSVEVAFQWQLAQPDHTYTVEQGALALELDRHNIARPAGLQWRVESDTPSLICIRNCFGPEFLETLIAVYDERSVFPSMAQVQLSKSQRLEIAKIQYASPATPAKLSKWLMYFLNENAHPADEHETYSI